MAEKHPSKPQDGTTRHRSGRYSHKEDAASGVQQDSDAASVPSRSLRVTNQELFVTEDDDHSGNRELSGIALNSNRSETAPIQPQAWQTPSATASDLQVNILSIESHENLLRAHHWPDLTTANAYRRSRKAQILHQQSEECTLEDGMTNRQIEGPEDVKSRDMAHTTIDIQDPAVAETTKPNASIEITIEEDEVADASTLAATELHPFERQASGPSLITVNTSGSATDSAVPGSDARSRSDAMSQGSAVVTFQGQRRSECGFTNTFTDHPLENLNASQIQMLHDIRRRLEVEGSGRAHIVNLVGQSLSQTNTNTNDQNFNVTRTTALVRQQQLQMQIDSAAVFHPPVDELVYDVAKYERDVLNPAALRMQNPLSLQAMWHQIRTCTDPFCVNFNTHRQIMRPQRPLLIEEQNYQPMADRLSSMHAMPLIATMSASPRGQNYPQRQLRFNNLSNTPAQRAIFNASVQNLHNAPWHTHCPPTFQIGSDFLRVGSVSLPLNARRHSDLLPESSFSTSYRSLPRASRCELTSVRTMNSFEYPYRQQNPRTQMTTILNSGLHSPYSRYTPRAINFGPANHVSPSFLNVGSVSPPLNPRGTSVLSPESPFLTSSKNSLSPCGPTPGSMRSLESPISDHNPSPHQKTPHQKTETSTRMPSFFRGSSNLSGNPSPMGRIQCEGDVFIMDGTVLDKGRPLQRSFSSFTSPVQTEAVAMVAKEKFAGSPLNSAITSNQKGNTRGIRSNRSQIDGKNLEDDNRIWQQQSSGRFAAGGVITSHENSSQIADPVRGGPTENVHDPAKAAAEVQLSIADLQEFLLGSSPNNENHSTSLMTLSSHTEVWLDALLKGKWPDDASPSPTTIPNCTFYHMSDVETGTFSRSHTFHSIDVSANTVPSSVPQTMDMPAMPLESMPSFATDVEITSLVKTIEATPKYISPDRLTAPSNEIEDDSSSSSRPFATGTGASCQNSQSLAEGTSKRPSRGKKLTAEAPPYSPAKKPTLSPQGNKKIVPTGVKSTVDSNQFSLAVNTTPSSSFDDTVVSHVQELSSADSTRLLKSGPLSNDILSSAAEQVKDPDELFEEMDEDVINVLMPRRETRLPTFEHTCIFSSDADNSLPEDLPEYMFEDLPEDL